MGRRRSNRTTRSGAGPQRGLVPLVRALSKLGILTRSQAAVAIRAGRVRVGGHVACDPTTLVSPQALDVEVDGQRRERVAWRTIMLHKPRGIVTTRRDPEGRQTVYDVLGAAAAGVKPVGRLDRASSGLLLLTSDPHLANWILDPCRQVPRLYLVTVRGRVEQTTLLRLTEGVICGHDRLSVSSVALRKASGRESHLTVELREGKNREVRRLFDSVGHEVTRLKRVALGGLQLGDLLSGRWRVVTPDEVRSAFPGVTLHGIVDSRVRSS